ncbi:hypothetical protein PQX77_017881 [Marasmius sp. AFHP31]|nr:hypothetical protein PQX77_017881 [Marasmius sp. AFHP31]
MVAIPIATTPFLPPEITDSIIDYCHSDSRTLALCSLVCRAWYASTRYHLFPVVKLSTVKKASWFTNLLEYRPSEPSLHIAPFLRHLTLNISPDSLWLPGFVGALPEYIPLVTLNVFCRGYHLTPEIRTKFAQTFKSITSLELHETTALAKSLARDVEFICAFTELKRVFLSGDHYRDTMIDIGRARLPSRVEKLEIDLASSATESLMGWLLAHEPVVPRVSGLHLFRVTDNTVPVLGEYIQRCRDSLEDLMLLLYQRRTNAADFDLSQHAGLRSVYLSASGSESIRTISDILTPLIAGEMKSTLARHIVLRISTFEADNVYDWAVLDKVLSSNGGSPPPKITVVMDQDGEYESKLRSRLSVCAAQKQLSFARYGAGNAAFGYVGEGSDLGAMRAASSLNQDTDKEIMKGDESEGRQFGSGSRK